MTTKLRPTAMGMLEVLMWAGAAGAVVVFWLWWPGEADKPARKRVAIERPTSSPVLFAYNAERELDSPGFQEWRNRFQEARKESELSAKLKDRAANDWPTSTGSHSMVGSPSEGTLATTPRPQPGASTHIVGAESAAPLTEAAAASESDNLAFDAAATSHPAVKIDAVSQDANSDPLKTLEDSTETISAERQESIEAEPDIGLPVEPEPALNLAGLSDLEPGNPESPSAEFARTTFEPAAATFDPPAVTVPEVGLVLVDLAASAGPKTASSFGPPETKSGTGPLERDGLVLKAEEMLNRGDVSGARLFFQRAAESGDARAAMGLARTYDSKVLRTLRVYGVRADPDQAAHWYARSKVLENVALR